jgi:WD40 repeat protein
MLLLTESGDAGGLHYAAFVYDLHSHNAKRFGSGRGLALSPDNTEALTVDPQDWTALTVTCLTSGRSTRVPGTGFRYQWAHFLNRDQLLVAGSYNSQPLEMAYQNIRTGEITAIPDAPYLDDVKIAPDGTKVAGRSSGVTEIFDLNTKSIERLPENATRPVAWSGDGTKLFVLSADKSTTYSVIAYNLATHQSAPWKTFGVNDPGAFAGVAGVAASVATDVIAYSAHLTLSRMYLVDGLL